MCTFSKANNKVMGIVKTGKGEINLIAGKCKYNDSICTLLRKSFHMKKDGHCVRSKDDINLNMLNRYFKLTNRITD